jgi:hypothetical protein
MYYLGYLRNRKNLQRPLCYPNVLCPTGYRYPLMYQAHIKYPKFTPHCQCDRYLRYI